MTPLELEFGGERRAFLIQIGELRKIQEVCGVGPARVAFRLSRCAAIMRAMPNALLADQVAMDLGDFQVDDVREPIRLGLLGAKVMHPNDVAKLIRENIDERGFRGLIENADLALALVIAGMKQPEDEAPGEPIAEAVATPPQRSTSAPSTKPAAPSASSKRKSTRLASGR